MTHRTDTFPVASGLFYKESSVCIHFYRLDSCLFNCLNVSLANDEGKDHFFEAKDKIQWKCCLEWPFVILTSSTKFQIFLDIVNSFQYQVKTNTIVITLSLIFGEYILELMNWVFALFKIPANSWQDPASIDIQWVVNIECQYWQDPCGVPLCFCL